MTRGFHVRGLGEIAIRCADLEAMTEFYRDVIGLEILSGSPEGRFVFLRIAEGVAGHTTVLALFHHSITGRPGLHPVTNKAPETGARSSLHHIALSLPFAEQDAVMTWYDKHDLSYRVEKFDWIGWRGVFTEDPEGNTVELVAFDPDWREPD